MKLYSESKEYAQGIRPTKGYVARCARCGRRVVHSEKTGLPFHMHARSRRCREDALLHDVILNVRTGGK